MLWEIWNEPNHRAYWGAPPNAADYGRLVRLTAERIKTIDPDAVIIAGPKVMLEGTLYDAYTRGDYVEKGDSIEVIAAEGTSLRVKKAE